MASEAERRDLLHFVVVGGGATSCEFATELSEFLEKDVRKWYPDLADLVSLSIVEAGPNLLAGFDETCWQYYTKHLREHNVDVRTGCAIVSVDPADDGRVSSATMANGTTMKFGCMVWSAGLAPIKFVEGSSLEKGKGGRIVVDEYLRAADRVFALGDCAASREDPLPPTANAAEQQGAYLAKCFNETYYKSGADGVMPAKPDPVRPSAMPFAWLEPLDNLWDARSEFRYVERGKMASMGMWGGVADLTKSEITPVGGTLTGVTAFASWRGAYLSKQVSVQNMILIPMCAPSVPDARGDGVQWNDSWTASPRAGSGSRAGCLEGTSRASKIVSFVTNNITRGFDWGPPGRAQNQSPAAASERS